MKRSSRTALRSKRRARTPRPRRVVAESNGVAESSSAEQAPQRSPSALRYGLESKPHYIAVCKHGFGIDQVPAMAIRRAQCEIEADAKPSQLLIYRVRSTFSWDVSPAEIAPLDFKRGAPVWPKKVAPQLCGLTNTHAAYRQKPRIGRSPR